MLARIFFPRLTASPVQRQLSLTIVILTILVLCVTGTSTWLLYRTSLHEEHNRLLEAAQSQARLIETILEFNQRDNAPKEFDDAIQATLRQVNEAHKKYKGFGGTGEFTLAQRKGDNIVFLLRHRHLDLDKPKPVPWNSNLAAPMRQALGGKSGVIIGADYRGEIVLAAHEPVAFLNAGIVAKIDMAEIRAPFIKAGLVSLLGALIASFLGAVLFWRISKPIQEYERTQQVLNESENRFRNLVEGSIQGVLIHQDFKLVFANQSIADMLGYENSDEILHLDSLLDVFPASEHANVIKNKVSRLQGDDAPDFYEIECVKKDGSSISMEIRLSVVDWNDQQAIQGTYVNVSDRKKVEVEKELAYEQLRAKDQLYQTILDNAPGPITLKDTNGQYILVNKAFADRRGLSVDDVVGKTAFELWPEDAAVQYWERDQEFLKSGNTTEVSSTTTDPEGNTVYYLGNKFPVFDSSGKITAIGGVHSDITIQKKAEELTQISEAQLRSIIDNSPSEISLKDLQGRYVLVNETFLRQRNETRETVIGKTIYNFRSKGRADELMNHDRQIIEGAQALSGESELILPDNTTIPVLWTKFPVYDVNGAMVGIGTISVNNADLRKALNEAREAQRLARIGSWELDVATGDLSWSAEIFYMFEIDRVKFDATYEAFLNAIHPDDRELVGNAYEKSLLDKSPYQIIHRLQMPDGRIKWVEEQCETDFDAVGNPLISRGTIQDITERKLAEDAVRQSEARFRGIMDNSPAAIVLKGLDGRIQFANKSFETWYGVHEIDVLGKTSSDVFPNEFASEYADHDREVTERASASERESPALFADGSTHMLSITRFPIFNDEGELTSIGAINVDITTRREAEENVRLALAETIRANQAKTEFLATMSHELRTPLNAIIGFSETMSGEYFGALGSEKYVEYANDIQASGQHLLDLINDLLDLSAIEAGKHQLSKEHLNALEVVEDCAPIVNERAAHQGVSYHAAIQMNLPEIWVDRRALKQILLNILSNAIKFTPEGGEVKLTLSTTSNEMIFETRDTGPGIPQSKLATLTDPFVRVEDDPYKSQEGTGLGLAIVKSLVELHDGQLSIKSKVGVGTTVTVTLPINNA
jgi:PAS domain S-box-containing protein